METSTAEQTVVPPPIPPQLETVKQENMSSQAAGAVTGPVGDGPDGGAAANEESKQDGLADGGKKEKDEVKEPSPIPQPSNSNTLLVNCANCNNNIEEVEIQVGRDVELDRLLNETLKTPLTMEICDDEQQNDQITATVEITMFEALIEIFSLRSKSPHLLPLLERVMKMNSIENANSLGLAAKHGQAAQQLKLLSLCDECTSRIANLYELYKEFTLLSMKSNAFFSRIVGSSSSGSFAKSNIKNVPVPKSYQKPPAAKQARSNQDDDDGPIIPEVYIDDDDSMDYSGRYSDNDDSRSYTMDVETIYGANNKAVKTTNSRGRTVLDHSSKGSGMYSEAIGSRRGDTKRKCNRCGKTYYYQTSYEKHIENCIGQIYTSDEDDASIHPDDGEGNQHNNSGPSTAKARPLSVSTPQEVRVYQCKYCPKICQSHANLQRHERTHGTTSSPSTTCKPCGRTFGSVYDLRRHYQTNVHRQRIRGGASQESMDDDVVEDWNYSFNV